MKRLCHIVFALFPLSGLLLGCDKSREPARLRIEQISSERYQMDDAVSALEYEGKGLVRYITRSGESGKIDLNQHITCKDAAPRHQQYGMPYQIIKSINLVSSSDDGIRVEGKSLLIPEKRNHYSAYKTIPFHGGDSLLSVTSDGVFLFTKRGGEYGEGERLFPLSDKDRHIDAVRFLDIVRTDGKTFFAGGHMGLVKIRLTPSGPIAEEEKGLNSKRCGGITHLRYDEGSQTLYAYAANGQVYMNPENSDWISEKRTAGVVCSFVEEVEGQKREWLIGCDQATSIWKGGTLIALIDDEESSGMQTLNNRLHFHSVEAPGFGYVLSRGRYIYVILQKALLSESVPVLSVCLGSDDKLYFKAGLFGEMSGLYRADYDNTGVKRPVYVRDIPRYGKIIAVKGYTAIVQSGNTIQSFSISNNSTPTQEGPYDRLVSARLDNKGNLIRLTQNAIHAYDYVLDNVVAGIENPADYYPQAFVPAQADSCVVISTIHKGIVVLRKGKDGIENMTVEGNDFFLTDGDPDTAILLENYSEREGHSVKGSDKNWEDLIYFYTKNGRIGLLSCDTTGVWKVKGLDSGAPLPERMDEIAPSQEKLYGINYFTRGWRAIDQPDKTPKKQHLRINGMCTVPGMGVVFACQEGVYCSWGSTEVPNPILAPSGWIGLYHDYPTLARALAIGFAAFLLLCMIIIAVLIIRQRGNGLEATLEDTTVDESSDKQAFKSGWSAVVTSLEGPPVMYVERLGRVVHRLVGEDYTWGVAICRRLQSESDLVRSYFEFLSSIGNAYQAKHNYTGFEDNKEVSDAYKDFSRALLKSETGREELLALNKTAKPEEEQVKTYFMTPYESLSKDKENTWFGQFIKMNGHHIRVNNFLNEKGNFGSALQPLVENRKGNCDAIGIVILAGVWGRSEERINHYLLEQSPLSNQKTLM